MSRMHSLGKYFILFWAISAQALEIEAYVQPQQVALDETVQFRLVLRGDIDQEPDFSPLEQDFEIIDRQQSQSTRIINGVVDQSHSYTLTLLPKRSGHLLIPAIQVGGQSSPELSVQVSSQASKNPSIQLLAELSEHQPYVQQTIRLTVRVMVRIQVQSAQLSEPEFEGEVLLQRLGEDRRYQAQMQGQTWQVVERQYLVIPQQSGPLTLKPMRLSVQVPVSGQQRFSPFFGRYERKIARSQPLQIEVRPIPQQFQGHYWLIADQVQLTETWSPEGDQIEVGEPLTRRIQLKVKGSTAAQLPEIDLPELPDWHIYADPAERHEDLNQLSAQLNQSFTLIANRAGDYQWPEIKLHWWNARLDRPEVAVLPARSIKVIAAAQSVSASLNPVSQAADQRIIIKEDRRWFYTSLALASAWLLTSLAWWQAKRGCASSPKRKIKAAKPDWSAFERALQKKEAKAVQSSLLALAAHYFDPPPHSLEELAQRIEDEEIKQGLLQLSRHLYRDPQVPWSPQSIAPIQTLLKKRVTKKPSSSEGLLPLYAN